MIRTNTIQKQASTGFTIVELIVVVGIVSIMSTMMLVQFTRNVKDERLKGVTREASVWLKDVQARSRQLMQTCRVQLNEKVRSSRSQKTRTTAIVPTNALEWEH